jgi:hypothetical protein
MTRASERRTDTPIERVGIRGGALGVDLHTPAHRVVGRVVRFVATRRGSVVVLKAVVPDLRSCGSGGMLTRGIRGVGSRTVMGAPSSPTASWFSCLGWYCAAGPASHRERLADCVPGNYQAVRFSADAPIRDLALARSDPL